MFNWLLVAWNTSRYYCQLSQVDLTYTLIRREACPTEQIAATPVTVPSVMVSTRRYPLMDVEPFATYNIKLVIAGNREAVCSVNKTTLTSEPPSVTFLVNKSSSSLQFSWRKPSCKELHGRFLHYNLTLKHSTYPYDIVETHRLVHDIADTTVTFSGLDACTSYLFFLYVSTNHGQSLVEYKQSQTMFDFSLDPVTNVGSKYVYISWTLANGCSYLVWFTLSLTQLVSCPEHTPYLHDVPYTYRKYNFSGLEPYSTYIITISTNARNTNKIVKSITVSTLGADPRPVTPEIRQTGGTFLGLSWDEPPCEDLRGSFYGYEYELRNRGNVVSNNTAKIVSDSYVNLTGLAPCTVYAFGIRVVTGNRTSKRYSDWGRVYAGTLQAVTNAWAETDSESNNLQVNWIVPKQCTNIRVVNISYELVQRKLCPSEPTSTETKSLQTDEHGIELTDLEGYAVYNITISIGRGQKFRLITATPKPISEVQTSQLAVNAIQVIWMVHSRCQSHTFQVSYRLVQRNACPHEPIDEIEHEKRKDTNNKFVDITDLEGYATYTISVTIVGSDAPALQTNATTLESAPSGPPEDILIEDISIHNNLTFKWTKPNCHLRNGPISQYEYVLTANDNSSELRNIINASKGDITDGVTFTDLQPMSIYYFKVRALNGNVTGKYSKKIIAETHNWINLSESSMPYSVTVSAVLSGFFLIGIAFIIGRYKVRHSSKSKSSHRETVSGSQQRGSSIHRTGHSEEVIELHHVTAVVHPSDDTSSRSASRSLASLVDRFDDVDNGSKNIYDEIPECSFYANVERTGPGHSPIPVDALLSYLAKKNGGKSSSLEDDYKTLPPEKLYASSVASKEENKEKNRFKNILPYDHSRVILHPLKEDRNSDYVNASFIDGFMSPAHYIASQGPNIASVNDFWRMLWQFDCGKIVMLANLMENGKRKCAKYWPAVSHKYGDIHVSLDSEENRGYYNIRVLKVRQNGITKTVVQYQFTAWPDLGVPEYPAQLLTFVEATRACPAATEGPTIVHCSAGVGRSGTFITLDAMLDQIDAENKIDVYNFIAKMRQNRPKMVQIPEQYRFIFESLAEYLTCGDTSIGTDQFLKMYISLVSSSTLRDKFQLLEATISVPGVSDMRAGGREANINKNRYQDKLPADRSRPFLMTEVEGGNDYINAAFLPGFKVRNQFIGTQTPLPNTVVDFWRLVMDYKVSGIVQLHGETVDEAHAQYWSDVGQVEFGPYVIRLLTKEARRNITRRTFQISQVRCKSPSRTVRQLQLDLCPTSADVPPSVDDVVEMLKEIVTMTDRRGEEPLLIHCSDGESLTGIMCALVVVIERMKSKGVVDVFHACKKIKATRYGIFSKVEQYEFVYEAVASYLKSETIYENLSN